VLGELRKIGLVDFNSIFNKEPKNIGPVAVVVKNKVVLTAVLNEEQSGLLKTLINGCAQKGTVRIQLKLIQKR